MAAPTTAIIVSIFFSSFLLTFAVEYNVLVNVGGVYGEPFGNLVMSLKDSKTPISLSNGGRKFEPNVPFLATVKIPTDLESTDSISLKWKVVDIKQMMEVFNLTFTRNPSERSYCAKSEISLLYLSQEFEYNLCQ